MKEMSQSFLHRLNIQLFAGAVDVKLSPGEQQRYVNSILRALGGNDSLPLQEFMQQDSTANAKESIFFGGKKLEARYRSDEVFELDGVTPKQISGVTKDKLLYSVVVTPKVIEVPIWIDDRSFSRTLLQEESFVTQEQISAVYSKAEMGLSELFLDIYTNKKRTVKDSTGATFDLTIPAKNFTGDSTKSFSDPANVKAFRGLMRKVNSLAKLSKRRVVIVSGTEGGTEINDCDKFTSKDFNEFKGTNPNQTGVNSAQLLSGHLQELITYDDVFYPLGTETTGVITVFVEKSFGQSAKKLNIKPTVEHVKHHKKYFMDVEIELATEIVQGEGVFFFTYKKDAPGTPTRGIQTATPQIVGGEQILKALGEIQKQVKESSEAAQTALEKVNELSARNTGEPSPNVIDGPDKVTKK